MKILSNTGGLAQTNCYLIADEAAKVAVLFDAPDHTAGVLLDEAASCGWDVIGLWLTHGHFDHIADHALVTARFPNAKVLLHKLDERKLADPRVQTSRFSLPFTIPPRATDGFLTDGQTLAIGSLNVEVIHTPGHAPGHVMFYLREHKTLVGGDLIICDAVGRTDLPDSNPADLDASVRRVMKLPDDTTLLPGHGDVTTIGEQRRVNLYLRSILNG